ncbi:myosin heavy chain, putative [Eimeria mitis]|uniref:Myosin heavy chain, putative n=1 Tax=Eimeria mitis TaxID=44415 RepID=U6K2Y1_9EIME|nr:myosin heavy chain, putative [Eimeria mitis]CDJ30687.1 myosin heavy chain, putative [Eimeria mitis]
MQRGLFHMDARPSGALGDSRLGSRGSLWSQASAESHEATDQLPLQRHNSGNSCSSNSNWVVSADAPPSRSGSLLLQVDQVLETLPKGMEEEFLLPQRCLGDKACPAIAKHLFRSDSASPPAVQVLCDSIAGLKALALLSLVHCQLGPRAADALSGIILQNSKSLREIHLRNNAIGEEGAAQLCTALKTNRNLTALDLTGNGARPSTLREVSRCCADNSKMLELLPPQQEEALGLQHSSSLQQRQQQHQQQHQKQQQQVDDYVTRIEAELKSTEQGSLEERYRELCESRIMAQQQKLQLQQQQQQQQQHQQQQAMLQRQLHDKQDTNEKLLSDLQQRELQLQQTELLLQQQQQDTARLQAELEQQQNVAERRQQMLQQEVDRLQQQQQQLQKQLLEEKDKHMQQQDGTLQQHQQLQQQQQQQQQRILELQQELQQEAQRRLQGEKEALEEKQSITANLTKAEQKVEELKQKLQERKETEELQQQQQQQLEQRVTELQQEAAAARAAAEELQTKMRHLAARAAAAEAEQQRQRDILSSRQKAQAECQRAQEEGRLAAARLQRQQREWQHQRDDLCVRLRGGIEQLQAVLSAARHQEAEMQTL